MTSNSTIRQMARQTLHGRWGQVVLLTIIIAFVSFLTGIPSYINDYLKSSEAIATSYDFVAYFCGSISNILIELPVDFAFSLVFLRLIQNRKVNPIKTFANDFITHYGSAIISTLLMISVILLLIAIATIVSMLTSILIVDLIYGDSALTDILTYMEALAQRRGDELELSSFMFSSNRIAGTLLALLSMLLLFLVCAIPTIRYYYGVAFLPYTIVQRPDLKIRQCFRLSRQTIKGHKWQCFRLDLSFVGWLLLCIPTLGIGLLFLVPYWQTARAHFYLQVTSDNTPSPYQA